MIAPKMTEEEFDATFTYTLDVLLATMAEEPEIDPEKFYSMACVLENLRFFSPVLYGALRGKED
ncbi:hypothetical protein [Pontibacter amylolyticus]|uniref:Uncharacterized protein n=1 Tax=Pontibacter amylolyticus TaxID=1424080 RepID=A0ABQ1VXF8_9BACT|nr:hypothetical protein [Pontibacter amylolyticus]GGG03277.1 hypothetical protein GCM10011323_05130 [Pontibacter amylolyticus]